MNTELPTYQLLCTVSVQCSSPQPLGRVQGGTGMMIPITGGDVEGEKLSGEVIPGGADFAVRYDNGVARVDAHYAIKTHDGVILQIHNAGSTVMSAGVPPRMLTHLQFTAPEGDYEWLNHGLYISTVQPGPQAVVVTIYQVV